MNGSTLTADNSVHLLVHLLLLLLLPRPQRNDRHCHYYTSLERHGCLSVTTVMDERRMSRRRDVGCFFPALFCFSYHGCVLVRHFCDWTWHEAVGWTITDGEKKKKKQNKKTTKHHLVETNRAGLGLWGGFFRPLLVNRWFLMYHVQNYSISTVWGQTVKFCSSISWLFWVIRFKCVV